MCENKSGVSEAIGKRGIWCAKCEKELAPEDMCQENCRFCGEPYEEFVIITCDECYGVGRIEWHEGPHLKSRECIKCEGSGKLRDTPGYVIPYED